MAVAYETLTIPAGGSLSNAGSISNATALFLTCPTDWTGGNLTFQFSPDGTTFADLFDSISGEYTIPFRAGAVMAIDVNELPRNGQIKVRSGSRDYPFVQEVDRIFSLAVIS